MARILTVLVITLIIVSCQDNKEQEKDSLPPDHSLWSSLLIKYIDDHGMVNYEGFVADSVKLKAYLQSISSNPPSPSWSEAERLAYWINAYNAFTVNLIVSHYPLNSIKDIGPDIQIPFINSPWDIEFIEIGGKKYDLNEIEHDILRKKFEEPRIHFAINCASMSCPLLRNEAYTPEKLERQLEEQTIAFINDPYRNRITKSEIEISKIFNWFRGDFIHEGKLLEYINRYSKIKANSNARIKYLEYNWKLNEQVD